MTIPLQYTYLIGALISFIPWLLLYSYRKDLRKPMLTMSIFMGIYAWIFEYFWWTRDWWQPVTVTGTRIGIEDFITAFSVGGIIASIYPIILRKKLSVPEMPKRLKEVVVVLILHTAMMAILYGVFGMHSYYTTTVTYLVTTLIILYRRRDLISNSLITGASILIGSVPIYIALFILTPVFVEKTWALRELTGTLFLGIPIEDLVFYFLLGMLFGPFYWYYSNQKFLPAKN